MHGTVFAELKKFVEDKYSHEIWLELEATAGVAGKEYAVMAEYPETCMHKGDWDCRLSSRTASAQPAASGN